MFTIIRAAQVFEDPAWRNYDETCREKAAATGNYKWSEIDGLIYNLTGYSQGTPRNPAPPPITPMLPTLQLPHRLLTSTMLPHPDRSGWRQCLAPPTSRSGAILYAIYSIEAPAMQYCKFRHMCSGCLGHNPRLSCKAGKHSPTQNAKDVGQARPRLIQPMNYRTVALRLQ